MTDEDTWIHDTLRIDSEGYVIGSAYTPQKDGYDVSIGVFSYEYERRGEVKMNHVPSVVITDERGTIIAEPHSPDSPNPERAIENARGTGEYVFENLEQFV